VVIQPMAGSDGKPERLLATSRDITERKRTEEEKERLAREVERRKVELEQLIYAASHDLRTPMVGVQGFVGELRLSLKDLLAELNRPDLPPEFRKRMTELTGAEIPESLKFIDAGVTRMSGLLSGLLRLSRLGRAEFQAESLDMNRVVGEVMRSLEFAAREAGAKVEVSDLPAALGDRMQMGQAFSNLVENAFKYRSPDRAPVIRITGRRDDGMAVYTVEDNGIGIAPEQQQRVFIPFFRADARTDAGEGLGLTIVSRIVERLGGRVWVESELGKGSRFYIALPTG
jgi:signal transduction histidine kinase